MSLILSSIKSISTFLKSDTNADKYPPHLNLTPSGPPDVDNINSFQIFDAMCLLDTGHMLAKIVPDQIKDFVFGQREPLLQVSPVERVSFLIFNPSSLSPYFFLSSDVQTSKSFSSARIFFCLVAGFYFCSV